MTLVIGLKKMLITNDFCVNCGHGEYRKLSNMIISIKRILAAFWLISLVGCGSLNSTINRNDPNLATLVVPFSIDLLAVDGVAAKLPFKRSDPYFYQVAPGRYKLDFIYNSSWGIGEDDQLVSSDVFAASVDVSAGQRLIVGFADDTEAKITNRQAEYKRDFALWLTDSISGQRIDAAYSRPYRGILDKLSLAFFDRSKSESAASTPIETDGGEATAVDAIKGQSGDVEAASSLERVEPSGSAVGLDDSSLEQLKSLWIKASQQERAEFLIWSTSRD